MNTKLTQRQRDKLTEASQNPIDFTVVGSGEFPFDMLRYDHAWPASESQARLMSSSIHVPAGPRRIEMRGLTGPTPARWASFGWKVVAINGEAVAR